MTTEQAKEPKTNEKIKAEFQQLRNEQKNIVNNLNTLEMDLKELKAVIETLQGVDPDRKCFRFIGGVLCELTVKEVLPQLLENKGFVEKTIKSLSEHLTTKGQQINNFKEEHNIKIRGEQMSSESVDGTQKLADDKKTETRNVLVSH